MQINITWLYYDLLNTYGDFGNLLTLCYRLEKRNIKYKVNYFTIGSDIALLEQSDLLLMGGGEDTNQKKVQQDLVGIKKRALEKLIKKGVPGLYICGAYQALGKYYLTKTNQKIPGLDLIPFFTKSIKNSSKRLIGNIVVKTTHPTLLHSNFFVENSQQYLIGFENHSGHTYLSNNNSAVGEIVLGFGNNDSDNTEGMIFKNSIGTYLHGPVLPRNPALADFLIEKALSFKYNQRVILKPLNDELEEKNRQYLLKSLNVKKIYR